MRKVSKVPEDSLLVAGESRRMTSPLDVVSARIIRCNRASALSLRLRALELLLLDSRS